MQARDPHEHSDSENGSWFSEPLRWLTRIAARNPRATLCTILMLSFVAVGYTLTKMEFRTSRSDLIDPQAEFQQRWLEYTKSFGDDADIVVVVQADNKATIRTAVDAIGNQLRREPETFAQVLDRLNAGSLRRKGLQHFTPQELEMGLRRLDGYRRVLDGRWDLTRTDWAFSGLDYQLRQQLSRPDIDDAAVGRILDSVTRWGESLNANLQDERNFQSPWPQMVTGGNVLPKRDRMYLMNDAGTMAFLKVRPAEAEQDSFNGNTHAVDRLREIIAEVRQDIPGAQIGLTGIPVLENDEMRRSQSDMLKASAISLIGVGLLLFIGFRGVRHPLLGIGMLLVGMAWTFGYTTFAVGHLNILSVSFAVILIGLGIDFAIHYLARYLELRKRGRPLRPALMEASGTVGVGIVTAAVTTSLAFFCATMTDFLGVAELGVIAGGGILLFALATFFVLPAMVSLADHDVPAKRLPTPYEGKWIRSIGCGFPRIVAILSIILIFGVGSQVLKWEDGPRVAVTYDANLLNLQADGLESVELQKEAFGDAGHSLLYAVSMADSPQEARELRRKFEALPSVDHVEDIASRLPVQSLEQTRPYLTAYRARLSRLPRDIPAMPRLNPASIGRSMENLLDTVRRSPHPNSNTAAEELDGFLDAYEALSLQSQSRFITEYQTRVSRSLLKQFQALAIAGNAQPLTMADLPGDLRSRFISSDGKWLLQVYPKEQIWDAKPLADFVADVRSVDPKATGTPLQNYEASRQIRDSYRDASLYALGIILLVLMVDFLGRGQKFLILGPPLLVMAFAVMMLQTRKLDVSPIVLVGSYLMMVVASAAILDVNNLRDTFLALMPPLAGGVLMFGIFVLAGISLNPANLIVLPLVLGIGVDDGVHVMHDFRLQRGRYKMSSSTMNAIVLTSLTTMVGFGSLLVAAHRGLASVGLALVIGVGCCLFVSLVTLPAILSLISDQQHGSRQSSAADDDESEESDDNQRSNRNQNRRNKRRAA